MSGWTLFLIILGTTVLTAQFFRLVDAIGENPPQTPHHPASRSPFCRRKTMERNF